MACLEIWLLQPSHLCLLLYLTQKNPCWRKRKNETLKSLQHWMEVEKNWSEPRWYKWKALQKRLKMYAYQYWRATDIIWNLLLRLICYQDEIERVIYWCSSRIVEIYFTIAIVLKQGILSYFSSKAHSVSVPWRWKTDFPRWPVYREAMSSTFGSRGSGNVNQINAMFVGNENFSAMLWFDISTSGTTIILALIQTWRLFIRRFMWFILSARLFESVPSFAPSRQS